MFRYFRTYGSSNRLISHLRRPKFTKELSIPEKLLSLKIIQYSGLDKITLSKRIRRVIFLTIIVTTLSFFTYRLIGLFLLPYFLLELFLLKLLCIHRTKSFDKDYPTFLRAFAQCLRSGSIRLEALKKSVELIEDASLLKKEVLNIFEDISNGIPEDQAIFNFGKSINNNEINLFRSIFLLSKAKGSSLYECLQKLAALSSKRKSIRKRISNALALQRLTGVLIIFAAIICNFMLIATGQFNFNELFSDPFYSKLLILGFSLILFCPLCLFFMGSNKR